MESELKFELWAITDGETEVLCDWNSDSFKKNEVIAAQADLRSKEEAQRTMSYLHPERRHFL